MKSVAILFLIIALQFSSSAQQLIYGSIMHDALQRDYILYVPEDYNDSVAVPLVFNFHGLGSNALEQMFYGDFRPIADSVGFLVVHPEGTEYNGVTHWNVGGFIVGSTVDDVGFTSALIDSLLVDYSIDQERVYATGMSNGGFMSFLLACQLSDRIAAIASVTGSMTWDTYDNCDPLMPKPVLQMHGTEDDVVPYDGAIFMKSIDDVLQYWVGHNNCSTTPIITDLPDLDPNDGSTVEYYVYGGGDNGVRVEHYKILGGGHAWPGSPFGPAGTNYDINASEEIWNFFSGFDINGLILPTGIQLNKGNNIQLEVFPNPAKSYVHINYVEDTPIDYILYSSIGFMISKGSISSNNQKIDLSGLPPGIYFLHVPGSTVKILKAE